MATSTMPAVEAKGLEGASLGRPSVGSNDAGEQLQQVVIEGVVPPPTRLKPPLVPIRKKDYTIHDFCRGADYLRKRTEYRPRLAVVLGSGMGEFLKTVEDAQVIPYTELHDELSFFPTCSVAGHAGALVVGKVQGVPILIMSGRFHLYEGHSAGAVTYPIRMMREFGIEVIILTSAAGGLTKTLAVGDVMLVTDHINHGIGEDHPLVGVNIDAHGPRFLSSTALYDARLRRKALAIAKHAGIKLKKGIYVFTTGPSYETPAEVRVFRSMCERHWLGPVLRACKIRTAAGSALDEMLQGAMDEWNIEEAAVGMSTVPEVLVANHCGMRVLALAGVPNVCMDETHHDSSMSHEDVIRDVQARVVPTVVKLVCGLVESIDDMNGDISIDLDEDEIERWKMPTKLCIPWSEFFLGVSFALLFTMTVSMPSFRRDLARRVTRRW